MTPETAPEAITQAEAWRVNPNTPSTIITPHGRISIRWTVASAGSASDYSLAEQTAAEIVEAMNHRRLTSHSAGEGLREASDYEADLSLLETLAANDYATRHFSNQLAGAAKRLRKALSLTPPSDAGSTTRPGGKRTLVAQLCRERAGGYGALRRSSLTAIALDRAADLLEREDANALANPSPDALPDSGEQKPYRPRYKTVQCEPTRAVCDAIEAAIAAGRIDHAWLHAVDAAPSPSPAIVKEAGEVDALRKALQRIADMPHGEVMSDPFWLCRIARNALSASNAAQVSK